MPKSMSKTIAFVLLAIGIGALWFWGPNRGEDPRHDVTRDVRRCVENMRAIHEGLLHYLEVHGALPEATGSEFLPALIEGGTWTDTAENRERLTCPGAGSYAVRDFAAYPLPRFPTGGGEPILACDNATGLNHPGVMNILFADKSVHTLVLEQEIARGRVPADSVTIVVGPDSPLPDLQKLRVD